MRMWGWSSRALILISPALPANCRAASDRDHDQAGRGTVTDTLVGLAFDPAPARHACAEHVRLRTFCKEAREETLTFADALDFERRRLGSLLQSPQSLGNLFRESGNYLSAAFPDAARERDEIGSSTTTMKIPPRTNTSSGGPSLTMRGGSTIAPGVAAALAT